MKKIIVYIGALTIFLFVGVFPLWAVNSTGKIERLDARLTTIPERITAVVARVTQAMVRKETALENMQTRKEKALQIAADKLKLLDDIWARVESRMKKMQANGKDLSSLQTKINDVHDKRQAAADAIDQAKATLMAETTPGTVIQKAKLQRVKIVPALRAYHQSIVTVIVSLMRMTGPSMTPQPTMTPSA